MQAQPTLSVVIPCYNAERYIAATLESVLAQAHPGTEIIVIDDGSSDGSVALLRRDFPQVRIELQANLGSAAARNLGITLASGDWIAFVDADDIWLPGKLEAQFSAMRAVPGCRMSYTAWQVWPCTEPKPAADEVARLQAQANEPRWRGPSGWIYAELLLDCCVWTSTVLAERSLFAEAGGFDTSLRMGQDYDLWLRLSRLTQIVRVAQPLALYRIHPANITKSAPPENYRARIIGGALARWGLRSPDGRMADQGSVQRMLARTWSDHAGIHLDAGNVGVARRAGWTALRTSVRHVPGWKVLVKALLKSMLPIHAKERS